MGSIFEWITIKKAADALGVSTRQVYKYIAKGRLTARQDGQQRYVSRNDVRVLLEGRKRGFPKAVSSATVLRMDTELQILRKQMDTVMRMLDMRYEPLGLDKQELVNLHEMANHSLKVPWSPHEEAMWADVFVKLSSMDLEAMSEDGLEAPWRPFLALAKAMYSKPHREDLKPQFHAGITNIERIGFSFSQKLEGATARDLSHMIKKDNVLTGRAERRMGRLQQKEEGPKE